MYSISIFPDKYRENVDLPLQLDPMTTTLFIDDALAECSE
ncbi:MAG: hypothetical protein ACJAYW_000398 [Candidatus Azotimanducaceae bacterium]|jgi:hypothetical protein